ncbi:hypothetical protein ACIA8K_06855 [Catenuloplanes sp. NPDC051500]|uniref:hypothetical protein n=1 Tax=Catenuloplanes sp. NPDC051500 TaxID=3363959 RepID=UPI0037968B7E
MILARVKPCCGAVFVGEICKCLGTNPASGTPTYGKPEYAEGLSPDPAAWQEIGFDVDEMPEPEAASVGWDFAGGMRLTFSAALRPGDPVVVFASMSDYEQANGVMRRTTDAATLRQYALLLLRLADAHQAVAE